MHNMNIRDSITSVICIAIVITLISAIPTLAQSNLFILNATIITGTGQTIENGSVLIRDGKVAQIGSNLSAPSGVEVIDASGKYVMPGIIDHHSHIGGGGNESTSQNSAMVDISDQVVHDTYSFFTALAGGVTTIHVLHGSANNIGGRDEVLKLKWGKPAEELLIPGNMTWESPSTPEKSRYTFVSFVAII